MTADKGKFIKLCSNYDFLLAIPRFLATFALSAIMCMLSGCSSIVLMHSQGQIGIEERNLIIIATLLMLIVVLPAMILTLLFAWKYRATNKSSDFIPNWQSKIIEKLVWVMPGIIVICLAILIWIYSHKLDPYRPLVSENQPLTIEVISLDWKWLFIYPEQNIASVNEIYLPINVPIHFLLTSDTVMNSFFIPQLGSQIMTMAGMQTQLHLIANNRNYSPL
jgi:cytochrome o ubiquinol oxidase subunit II